MKGLTRHELKHDKYVDSIVVLGRRLAEHRLQVAGWAAFVLLISAIVGWRIWSARTAETSAWSRLAYGESLLARATRGGEESERLLKEAAEACDGVYHTFPKTLAAGFALWRLGDARYRQGKYSEAVAAYEEFLAKFDNQADTSAMARRSLACALEEMGRFEDAARQYEQFVRSDTPEVQAMAQWDAGRCWEAAGRLQAARSAYEKAVAAAPLADAGKQSRYALDRLERSVEPLPGQAEAASTSPVPAGAASPIEKPKGEQAAETQKAVQEEVESSKEDVKERR